MGSNANPRKAKLKKRKKAKSSPLDKRASAIEFSSSKSSLVSSSPTNVSSKDSFTAVGPLTSNELDEITQTSHCDLKTNHHPDIIAAPHQNTSLINASPQTGLTSPVEKSESPINEVNGTLSPVTREPKPRRRRYSTCRLKKTPSESSVFSSLSAMKRRFSYCATTTNSTSDYDLLEEELKGISITATRIPDFSSVYETDKIPSPAVQVTIVDQLPHQKSTSPTSWRSSISSRRFSNIPPTIAERDINDEFLLEQQEVMSYLQNTLLCRISPESSPKLAASDGGLPITPPVTKPTFQQPPKPINSADFIDEMISEFPYLLGNDDMKSILDTQPLQLRDKSKLYGLGLIPSASSISSFHGGANTEFPPSPPQSERRQSTYQSHALLEELGLESDSMRSFVDAVNNAASSQSSFVYTDSYDNESLHEDDESFSLQFESLQLDGSRPWTSQSVDPDNDSIYNYAAPIFRTGRASFPYVEPGPHILSRSASRVSRSTVFEDGELPIAEVLAERRRSKPQLSPLLIAPIAQGQYGPPIQRRHHRKGRGKSSSPMSACGSGDAVKPTLVKVVEEEIVEYTPIEEGEKGWMRQRRVSRGGDWVVVEREILERGAI